MNNYQIATIEQIWIVIPYLIVVTILYWSSSRSFLKSAHGALILLAFAYAVLACEFTEFGVPQSVYVPMHILLVAGLISIAFSFKAFQGRLWVHAVHVFTLLSAFLVWFIGSMAISHDWI